MKEVISIFDKFLLEKKLSFEAIIIGGAALNIMDVVSRTTKDVDFLDPNIPESIKEASIEFAKVNPSFNLDPNDWFNNGPEFLKRDLPKNWRETLQVIFKGEALILHTLGRLNLLRTKLYAYADRDIDFEDCIALSPSLEELNQCKPWVLAGDTNELWPSRVEEAFTSLIKELKLE